MSDFLGIWAELQLPEAAVPRWWKTHVSGTAWDDWTGWLEAAGSPGRAEVHGTVKELFDGARKVGKRRTLYDLTTEGGKIALRAVLSLDDDLSTCAELAVALRAAGDLGGKGDVVVADMTGGPKDVHVKVARSGSRCTKATAARIADVLDALNAAASKADSRPPSASGLGLATRDMVLGNLERMREGLRRPELRALHERLLTAMVERCSPGAILEAAKGWRRPYRVRPPEMTTVAQVVEVLRKRLREDEVTADHFASLELLATHDYAAASAIARVLLDVERGNWHAVLVVARSQDPRDRELLLRVYDEADRAQKSGPLNALIHMRDAGVSHALLPRFEEALRARGHASGAPWELLDPERAELLRLAQVLSAHSDDRGYGAVARVYRACQSELASRMAAIAVKRRETWAAFQTVPLVLFERRGELWVRQLVPHGEGSTEWCLGVKNENDARRRAVAGSSPDLLAEELGKRLLFDGKPPTENWLSAGYLYAFEARVEAILKRRGL